MYMYSLVSDFCSGMKQLKFKIYIILCRYSYHTSVFLRNLKYKKMIKLKFQTAISSHQVMGVINNSVRYGNKPR